MIGKYYKHFKGNIYRVLHIAKHSETLEDMIVYQAMYGESRRFSLTLLCMSKTNKYQEIYKQIESLVSDENDQIANMANTAALLHEAFGFWWTGFYIVKDSQLVLGPFQGPIACTRIGFGKGVCGSAWQRRETIVVPDVHEFPGHIACSSLSQSEIVVPMFHENEVYAVLDIDSKELSTFDEVDKIWLEKIVCLLSQYI